MLLPLFPLGVGGLEPACALCLMRNLPFLSMLWLSLLWLMFWLVRWLSLAPLVLPLLLLLLFGPVALLAHLMVTPLLLRSKHLLRSGMQG